MAIKEINMNESEELDPTEIKEDDNSFSISNSGEKEWRNNQLVPLHLPIKCKVPHSLLIMMRTIEKQVESKLKRGKLEFGAFLIGKFEHGILNVEDKILILKQKVTGASIDFLEDPPVEYNGIMHRHPSGCVSFSGTDASSINQNSEFSLLYVSNEISKGILNLKLPDNTRLQLPLEVEIIYPVFSENIDELVSKIEVNMPSEHPLSINNRLLGENGERLQFPDFNYNQRESESLFDNLSEVDDRDDYLEDVFECPVCGYYQTIDDFPAKCESCETNLEEGDVTELNDVPEDQRDQTQIIRIKMLKLQETVSDNELVE